jgi:prepilin signal peptidase PulO-like enzyme (type II secretory pathway)
MNIQPEDILLIAWFFMLGAVIGSFLNVVIYRVPRGMSLIVPGSHCPKCNRPISWHDNIPIASWLFLGGKCRGCRAPISGQYPLVEGVIAATFALLAAAEYVFKGINLPQAAIRGPNGAELAGWNTPELYGLLLFHLLLLCTLFAAAMIEINGLKPPWRLYVPALIAGVIGPLVLPFLHPVPAWPGLPDMTGRIVDCAAGLAVGGLLGFAAWKMQKRQPAETASPKTTACDTSSKTKSPGAAAWGLLCIAFFLGWQAACGTALLAGLMALIAAALGKIWKKPVKWSFSIFLFITALAWILAWAAIVHCVSG